MSEKPLSGQDLEQELERTGFEEYDDPDFHDDSLDTYTPDDDILYDDDDPDSAGFGEDELEQQWQTCLACADEAEAHAGDPNAETVMADIVDRYLACADCLKEFEHTLDRLYVGNDRLITALEALPRLRLKVMYNQRDVLEWIEAREGHDLMILQNLCDEIDELEEQFGTTDE